MKQEKTVSQKRIALLLFILSCASIVAMLFFSRVTIISTNGKEQNYAETEKTYHILVAGTSENEAFLRQVYKGTQRVSTKYDAVVELLVPESLAEDVSLQSLMDYASFVEADGVIAYINSETSDISPPLHSDGTPIPFITVGHYDPVLSQVSFIGTNYSELGLALSRQILSYLGTKGSVLIVNETDKNDPNYSTLMNTLLNTISGNSDIIPEMMNSHTTKDISIEDRLRQRIAGTKNIDLIVCLNENDTIRISQTVTDLNMVNKIGIIGLGESIDAYQYYAKGIISSLLSLNLVKIGETAMNELFEYKAKGSANSYIMADVQELPLIRK